MNEKQTARANRLAGEVVMGWEVDNYNIADWESDLYGADEMFFEDRYPVMPVIAFCPCSNWGHAGMVIDKMIELKYKIAMEHLAVPSCFMWKDAPIVDGNIFSGETLQEVVVKTALAVFGYDTEVEG